MSTFQVDNTLNPPCGFKKKLFIKTIISVISIINGNFKIPIVNVIQL